MRIQGDDYCFACGPANPIGLKLRFRIDAAARAAEATFTPCREHQGYRGVVHGGLLATVLDEAMIKLCWELGIPAVTARFEMDLKKPAMPGEVLRVRGWLEEESRRLIRARAEITDAAGEVVAAARCTAVVQAAAP